jgi:hypothetical protein
MVPEKTRHELAELFAAFILDHPSVSVDELTMFGRKFTEILGDYLQKVEKEKPLGRVIQFGPNNVEYIVHTSDELHAMGLRINPNLYIGDGQLFCIPCNTRTRHYAMSSGIVHAEVCTICKQSTMRR